MRVRMILAAFLVLTGIGAGGMASARADDAQSSYASPSYPDPKPDNGTHFTAAQATAGTAIVSAGPATDLPRLSCSPLTPCATVTPALDTIPPAPGATLSRAATVHKHKG